MFNKVSGEWEPPVPAPELTQEQIDLGLIYIWNFGELEDEQIGWTIDISPDYEYPALTEDELKNGCEYVWNRKKYVSEGIFEIDLYCPPSVEEPGPIDYPLDESELPVGIAST